MKRTRIVATIGPACSTQTGITKLIESGVNVARLNFSHGTYEDHAGYIRMIRTAAKKTGRTVSILQDLCGPKIRVGELPPEGIDLKDGESVVLSNTSKDARAIPFQYKALPRDVKRGDRLLFDDGLLEVEVAKVVGDSIHAIVITGGILHKFKGINVPSARLSIPAITEKDKRDLEFGLAHSVDWVALSFVRDPDDIEQLRKLIGKIKSRRKPRIIAKIEKHEAVQHLEEIVRAADAIMVARGDLGIEIPAEHVPLVQKRLIKLCVQHQKPVIVATQMMDSMIRNPRPTRAEVSDVANAVFDMTDAVMLSGESASGKYPQEAVSTMARILETVENVGVDYMSLVCHPHFQKGFDDELVGEIALTAAQLHRVSAVIVPHDSRHLIPLLARFRPQTTIVAQLHADDDAGMYNLHFGVYPVVAKTLSRGASVRTAVKYCRAHHVITKGDRVVVLSTGDKKTGLISVEELAVA